MTQCFHYDAVSFNNKDTGFLYNTFPLPYYYPGYDYYSVHFSAHSPLLREHSSWSPFYRRAHANPIPFNIRVEGAM